MSALCAITDDFSGKPAILVLGDSHADQLTDVLADLGRTFSVPVYYSTKQCSLGHFGPGDWCSVQTFDSILHEAKWKNVVEVLSIRLFRIDREDVVLFRQNVRTVLAADFHLTIMENVPTAEHFDPTERALRAMKDGSISYTGLPVEKHSASMAEYRLLLSALVREHPGQVSTITPEPLICPSSVCEFATDGRPNYFDWNHLTQTGAGRVMPVFEPIFRRVARGD